MSEEFIKILLEIKEELGEVKATGLSTLEQAKKTNGRVTCLEESNLKLSNIVSRHNGILMKWEEDGEEDRRNNKLLIRRVSWIVGVGLLIYIFRDLTDVSSFLTKLI